MELREHAKDMLKWNCHEAVHVTRVRDEVTETHFDTLNEQRFHKCKVWPKVVQHIRKNACVDVVYKENEECWKWKGVTVAVDEQQTE